MRTSSLTTASQRSTSRWSFRAAGPLRAAARDAIGEPTAPASLCQSCPWIGRSSNETIVKTLGKKLQASGDFRHDPDVDYTVSRRQSHLHDHDPQVPFVTRQSCQITFSPVKSQGGAVD